MGQASFLILTLAATFLVSVVVLWKRSVRRSHEIARAFYFLCIILSFSALLCILLGVSHILPETAGYVRLLQVLIYRGWLVIGAAVSSAFLIVLNAFGGLKSRTASEATRALITSPYLLKGISVSVSISFLCTEIGKLAHDADMRQFFVQSDYPVWFLYFVIVAETAGAIGLLIPKTALPAALGLMVIMGGAIRTHWHNHDPFSDSLEAFHLLVLLACIVVIRPLGARVQLAQEQLCEANRV